MKHWFSMEHVYINIENVVASARLDENINLDSVTRLFPVARFFEKTECPGQFSRLVLRIEGRRILRVRMEEEEEWEKGEREGIAVLVFGSGNMVLTGAKSEREARNALSEMINQLFKAGIVTSRKLDVGVQNIVASAALGEPVDLERAACNRGVMYEPEQFPGLVCRMDDPKVVILLFASGKLVCTGAKKEPEVRQAVVKLKRLLQESRSTEGKYAVDVLEVPDAIPFPNASLEAIKEAVKGKALERMMKEAVDCPVKARRVSFVECYTCSNFNHRIKGKISCAGLAGVGP